jgi:2-methylisocitrate lyase-like PEP mutase family enzyme
MMDERAERVELFRALHGGEGAFILPNPWDRGSAILLEQAGFSALATTSAGFANAQGLPDAAVGRDMMLTHCREIAAATSLPVSADLENGFADDPATVAETIRLAAETGLCGGSIEDASGDAAKPIYDPGFAVERIHAAVEASKAVPGGFVLTARAENFLHGRPDLGDTIRRLQSFQEAGADVLYAPGITRLEDLATLVREVDRPVNALPNAGLAGVALADYSRIGVKRISLGSLLARVAYGALIASSAEMAGEGRFDMATSSIPYARLNGSFTAPG